MSSILAVLSTRTISTIYKIKLQEGKLDVYEMKENPLFHIVHQG